MKTITVTLTIAMSLTVLACSNSEPLGRDHGNSVRHNMAVHIINPAPNYAGRDVPATSGVRAARAMDRYMKGEVTKLKIESTSKKSSK